jgi:hypothetical protein
MYSAITRESYMALSPSRMAGTVYPDPMRCAGGAPAAARMVPVSEVDPGSFVLDLLVI